MTDRFHRESNNIRLDELQQWIVLWPSMGLFPHQQCGQEPRRRLPTLLQTHQHNI